MIDDCFIYIYLNINNSNKLILGKIIFIRKTVLLKLYYFTNNKIIYIVNYKSVIKYLSKYENSTQDNYKKKFVINSYYLILLTDIHY